MRRLSAPLLALLAAGLLAGCSGQAANKAADEYKGDEKAVATVIDDFANAGQKGDAKEICNAVFAKEVADRLKQGTKDCQDVVADQLGDANSFKLDVKSVKVNGDTATANVTSPFDGKDQSRVLTFRKEGTTWRLLSMGGAG
jgi:hypothetical protein